MFFHRDLQIQWNHLILFLNEKYVLCDAQKNTKAALEHPEIILRKLWISFSFKFPHLVSNSFSQEKYGFLAIKSKIGTKRVWLIITNTN